MKINDSGEVDEFKKFEFTILVETEDELLDLYHRLMPYYDDFYDSNTKLSKYVSKPKKGPHLKDVFSFIYKKVETRGLMK